MSNRLGISWKTKLNLGSAGVLAAGVVAALLMSGCQRPEEVKVLKTPDEVEASKKPRKPRVRNEKKTVSARRTPWLQPDAPAATPTPEVARKSFTLTAADMWSENAATSDTEGGRTITRRGALQKDNVNIDFPIQEVVLEMKGDPSGNVWPEVNLNMYNRTTKKNYFPWQRDYVTTSSYFEYAKPVEPVMPPGSYLVTFRYYNDEVPSGSKDDRNVSLRKITFLGPDKATSAKPEGAK